MQQKNLKRFKPIIFDKQAFIKELNAVNLLLNSIKHQQNQ